jgi:hypothetical protein
MTNTPLKMKRTALTAGYFARGFKINFRTGSAFGAMSWFAKALRIAATVSWGELPQRIDWTAVPSVKRYCSVGRVFAITTPSGRICKTF